jgi:hypothetical protein
VSAGGCGAGGGPALRPRSALNRTFESFNSHLLFRYSFNILFYILHFSFVLWLATNIKRMNSSS